MTNGARRSQDQPAPFWYPADRSAAASGGWKPRNTKSVRRGLTPTVSDTRRSVSVSATNHTSFLLCDDGPVAHRDAGVVVWDVDGTLIPADLRWLRRAIAATYQLSESDVTFPEKKVHGYTDESIVVDTAVASGIAVSEAEAGVARFGTVMAGVMERGREELVRVQPPYPGVAESIAALHKLGFVQTVLTGNLRAAADVKIASLGLGSELDLDIGAYGSDAGIGFNCRRSSRAGTWKNTAWNWPRNARWWWVTHRTTSHVPGARAGGP